MPQLLPIRAIRYAASHAAGPGGAADVSRLIAPPYDVLDEGPKQRLLADDPHNIVAIDLPVTPPKTVGPDEAYLEAGRLLRDWIEQDVLRRDDTPAVFACEQVYRGPEGETLRRRGLLTALGLEEFNRPDGGIFRHEHTIQSGTDDRLKLMRATRAQLSPVFGIFSDERNKAASLLAEHFDQREPDFRGVTAHDSVEHRCWVITDRETIDGLSAQLQSTDVFIADGHHRYTTALTYARRNPASEAAQGCLFMLVPSQDPGLIVRPTHRVLCGPRGFDAPALLEAIEADGRLAIHETDNGAEDIPRLAEELADAGPHAFGLYDPQRGRTYAVRGETADPLADVLPDKPAVWRKLGVAVVHELFVDRILRPRFGGDEIIYKYPHELAEMVRLSHEEPGRLGLIMQPTPLQAVCDVARAGEVMPPKSTFFHPKVPSGLVLNPLGP